MQVQMKKRKSVLKEKAASKGIGFGLTSGIITVLGMIIGINAATSNRIAVVAGIVSTAVADTLSDSFGIHISEESEGDTEEWKSTIYTFASKFCFTAIFLVPFLLLDISTAIILSVAFGLAVISVYSYIMAKTQGKKAWMVVGEHLLIAAAVMVITYFTGYLVRTYVH